jgi:uncharacterized cupredoxin-like copper-binding protein
MNGSRTKPVLPRVLLGVASLLAALIAVGSAAAAHHGKGVTTTTVVVQAGQPSELAFKVSKTSLIPPGNVVFKVTNDGKIPHDFEICLSPVTKAANFCKKGLATKPLQPGKSASVKVLLSKKGDYEFLCTLPGHASAGMKGLLGVGVKVAATPVPTSKVTTLPTSTPPTSTSPTTTSPATTTAANDGCAPGQTIQSTGNTDGDDDEAGRPSDDDGCV